MNFATCWLSADCRASNKKIRLIRNCQSRQQPPSGQTKIKAVKMLSLFDFNAHAAADAGQLIGA